MRTISKAALAVALVAGAGGLAIAPSAIAQKKSKEAEQPKLKYSPEILKAAQAAQTALAAKDFATAGTTLTAAQAIATSDDDRYIVAALQLQLLVDQSVAAGPGAKLDDVALRGPLDVLLTNPKTPAANLPRYAFQRGLIAYNAKQYPEAMTYLERARQLGYSDPNLSLQIVKTRMDMGDVAGGSAELEKTVAQASANGGKADESLYRYAIAKTNQKRMGAETQAWLKRYIAAYPTTKNWRDVIVTYGLQNGGVATLDKAQKVDLYRLLRANKALADQYDYEIYGQWVFDLGLPFETKAVLTEGKASGKIPASSTNASGALAQAETAIRNEGSLAALEPRAKSAANGKLAASTADAYLGTGNHAKSIELYRLALSKGGVDTDAVNTHLGIALALSGDKAAAKTAFAAVTGAPRADIAGWWITWLDMPAAA